ncbi:hypothetical protein PCL_01137 [Purpureocillium lilacinum]|uniref:Uncharacterized protein n=1 Tax=Purpureocillium lilacinum TaxID=33203 RepID=A0A2U3E4Q4_PURLI|nr:hypothetical protein Purlil1_8002 [Purpureocillium lilacinum]PWI69490.1 hypothetical protein PCL_01137 [Purpureocillium lilacinum]
MPPNRLRDAAAASSPPRRRRRIGGHHQTSHGMTDLLLVVGPESPHHFAVSVCPSLSLVLKSPRVPLPLRDARSFVCRSRALVLPSYVIASLHNFTQQPRLKTKSDRLSRLSTRSWPCPAVSTQPNPATTTSDRTRTSTRSSHKRQLQSHPRWLLRRQL